MSNELKRLELTWIGKDEKINPEPRILMYDESKSYGDQSAGNLLIHGDNLLALKALELEYAGRVKCIYIDPPYNTGSAFEHYNDNMEHSTWLSLMKPRFELLRNLLSGDGSIWINLDDNEVHYCKVMLDEIFGRGNFLCDIAWEKRYSPPPDTKDFGYVHDHILVYRKSQSFRRNLLPLTEDQTGRYKNPDNDSRGDWKATDYTCRYTREERPNLYYPITQPITGEEIYPKETRVWAFSYDVHKQNEIQGKIWWGTNGTNRVPSLKNFFTEINQGMMPMSLWKHTLAGHTQDAMKEMMALFGNDVFTTPKPERLIQQILIIATNPGDLILDSFLGSGTTAAVAHKMGRRWIGIELGEHCYTHCVPRLKAVIDGEQGGISKAVDWQGGGGYRFLELAETLLKTNQYGHLIINPKYNAEMLAAAMAKHKGYIYNPDQQCFWKQGKQGANNYIFTTTMFITPEYLDMINLEMAENEHLLICCEAFDEACRKRQKRITVQKIPKILLGRCEFGKNNYDLNVILEDNGDWEGDEE